jgi:hypothetical protein
MAYRSFSASLFQRPRTQMKKKEEEKKQSQTSFPNVFKPTAGPCCEANKG